jgi:hypothetical protein
MSVSLYLSRPEIADEVILLVGNNELHQVWLPIIQEKQCAFLEYALTSGLSVNIDNYEDILNETKILYLNLAENRLINDEITNPLYRCNRLLQLLIDNPPSDNYSIYIG